MGVNHSLESEAEVASCSRKSRSAWYPSTCLVASSSCSLARCRRFSSLVMREWMVSMSRRRWGRAGPRFFRGWRGSPWSDFGLSVAALAVLGARSVLAFFVGRFSEEFTTGGAVAVPAWACSISEAAGAGSEEGVVVWPIFGEWRWLRHGLTPRLFRFFF